MYDFSPPPWKFSGRTKNNPREKSQFGNSLSSSRFELRTSQKQSYMVTTVPNYFYLPQMQELGTSGPNTQTSLYIFIAWCKNTGNNSDLYGGSFSVAYRVLLRDSGSWYHTVFCRIQGLLRDYRPLYHAVFCRLKWVLRDSGSWYHAVFCRLQRVLRDSGPLQHRVFCKIQGLLRDSD